MEQLLDLALMLRTGAEPDEWAYHSRLAARLGFFAIHVPTAVTSELLDALQVAADPAMIVIDDDAGVLGVVRRNDPALVRAARASLDELEDARPLIVAVPISVGRTLNEAVARADRDPRFVGDAHPRECGIFGTFEEAQEQVLELARAGAEVLLVTVPNELDVADILAQVRALVVGATPALFDQ